MVHSELHIVLSPKHPSTVMVSKRQMVVAATMGLAAAENITNISSDTLFYGQSPPVYPARKEFL